MSHLITNTLPLEDKPMIDFSQKTFIKPNLKKIIKAQTQPNDFQPHQQIIDRLCFKLQGRQSIRLSQQNTDIYINHKKKLKHKRNSSICNSQAIEEIFTRDSDRTEQERIRRQNKNHINVLKYLEKMPAKVHLHQKYNNTINQKINVLQQIREIQKGKENYRNWHNQNNNSPIKNPNFTKMTFLLQKLSSDGKNLASVNQNLNQGQQRMFKLIESNSTSKLHEKSRKLNKFCVPNVTLQPIGMNKYRSKNQSKWFESNDMTQNRK